MFLSMEWPSTASQRMAASSLSAAKVAVGPRGRLRRKQCGLGCGLVDGPADVSEHRDAE